MLSVIRNIRGGELNDPDFGTRMRGEGPFADLIRQRIIVACRQAGIKRRANLELDTRSFVAPRKASAQGDLFA